MITITSSYTHVFVDFLQINEALLEILDDCDDDFNLDSEVQAGVTTGIRYISHCYAYTFFLFISNSLPSI